MATMPTPIARVLAGQASYDTLSDRAQALVRVSWNQQIAERLDALDFADELRATGQRWFEADAGGAVVVRESGPTGV
jgi:hypothetical protein